MKFHSYLVLVALAFCKCTGRNKTPVQLTNIDTSFLSKEVSTDKGIIISCFRCTCIDQFMNSFVEQNISTPVYADTGCFKLKPNHLIHFEQKKLDRVCERNYNALLFNKRLDGSFRFHLLKTEDAGDFGKIGENFFRGD